MRVRFGASLSSSLVRASDSTIDPGSRADSANVRRQEHASWQADRWSPFACACVSVCVRARKPEGPLSPLKSKPLDSKPLKEVGQPVQSVGGNP